VRCLEELFRYYLASPGSMPEPYEELTRTDARHVVVCDYIAGMTDQFLLRKHRQRFGADGDAAHVSA
jgi:dGTPase